MLRVLIFGAYGMLGRVLAPSLEESGYTVFSQGRAKEAQYTADPTNPDEIVKLVADLSPDVAVNLIAMTNVDGCEENLSAAFNANVASVVAITRALQGRSCHLIHISTDQVYSGQGPHKEMLASPCNVYGLSKYTGELIAGTVGATVLRTNFVGRSLISGRVAFTDWLVSSLKNQEHITLFDDVLFNPLHMSKLCDIVEETLKRQQPGTFNVGSKGGMSKANFALELGNRLGLDTSNVLLGKVGHVRLKAPRPLDMRMDISNFAENFDLEAPSINQTIDSVAREYLEHTNVRA